MNSPQEIAKKKLVELQKLSSEVSKMVYDKFRTNKLSNIENLELNYYKQKVDGICRSLPEMSNFIDLYYDEIPRFYGLTIDMMQDLVNIRAEMKKQ